MDSREEVFGVYSRYPRLANAFLPSKDSKSAIAFEIEFYSAVNGFRDHKFSAPIVSSRVEKFARKFFMVFSCFYACFLTVLIKCAS